MALLGSLFPLIGWLLYAALVARIEQRRPSISTLMNRQRKRWVTNALNRDTPLDAILSSNLMSAVSFFASTTVLLILGVLAVFGQLPALREAISAIRPNSGLGAYDLELHLITVEALFVLAFLAFTLSLRQFNHFCIMLGAANRAGENNDAEITAIARLNALGAYNFNQGIRAYYFTFPMIAWFIDPIVAIAATILVMVFLLYREFYSPAHTLASSFAED